MQGDDVYYGEFEDDMMNGDGIFKYQNLDIYIGQFKDNKKNGKG